MLRHFVSALLLSAAVTLAAQTAHAHAKGVGLGVGAGVAYSGTDVTVAGVRQAVGARLAWGFFVDIPLLSTFYITPSAMLYDMDVGGGRIYATDVDINFKFIVPVASARFGAGLLGGLTTGLGDYGFHFGLLGFGSYNLVSNLDGFIMVQYKRLIQDGSQIDDIHGYAGIMFQF